jgi:hypothetical protein
VENRLARRRPAKFVMRVRARRTNPTSARACRAIPVESVKALSKKAAIVADIVENGSKILCG